MSSMGFQALRRRLAEAGGRPARAATESPSAHRDAPAIRVATLIESPLRHIAVAATPFTEPLSFLDGVQHTELIGYVGTAPVVAARIAAGVRQRVDRVSTGRIALERHLVLARASALEAIGTLPVGSEPIVLAEEEPTHPVADQDRARAAVDAARTNLEIRAAQAFRAGDATGWLVVDGTLTVSPDWSGDRRMVAVVKSHATLPFEGAELECYLTLPAGHRTSVFAPASRSVTPVHSWAVRLWPWHGRDLLFGLVRLEAARHDDPTAIADWLTAGILAERAPLANDPRQDRLLYGIHDVERWLRARSA